MQVFNKRGHINYIIYDRAILFFIFGNVSSSQAVIDVNQLICICNWHQMLVGYSTNNISR